ncbi:SpoIIE family protein phosphatase [Streptomyces sp. DSM 41014]|uniref:SpoIIE family protein phosphatase n=1 Tax=Streptomyces hintoniae TaxID=3075521 RepID=A0ABU2UGV3_9ACTN|nr:SpoIIE family protein phosphatase [Streptomyces sp. DSM 41014]MDT0472493.1 SpoIIE family protein phosphatase [Streptomyces sp. DSM 41014]
MPPPLSADRPAAPPPGRGPVDALITQTRRLKGDVDAVRREARGDATDPLERWHRALCELALHQLDDLGTHLAQLRDGPQGVPAPRAPMPASARRDSLLSRVGSAEWNLLTDEVSWSAELYRILGRDPAEPALTLDELPSLVHASDRAALTALVTGCLIDARPIDGEFRVLRPDGEVRTVHMMGEPVLAPDGGTTSMWAVLRDVSELRRTERTVRRPQEAPRPPRTPAAGPATPREPLPRQGTLGGVPDRTGALDIAVYGPASPTGPAIGASWSDALDLPDGGTLLGVGDLTGHTAPDSGHALLLGALRALALAGTAPGHLLTLLNQVLDTTLGPALAGAVCCAYRPETRTLTWAQAGRPAPLLFRGGTGRALRAPAGTPLGTAADTAYEQAATTLEPGDVLLLHTGGVLPGPTGPDTTNRLLALAPHFRTADTAQDCVRLLARECGGSGPADHGSALFARVTARSRRPPDDTATTAKSC